jgi:hypothetical protein
LRGKPKVQANGGSHPTPTRGSPTIKGQLGYSKNSMKQQADQHHNKRQFEVGD